MNELHKSSDNPQQTQDYLGLETRFRIKRDYPKIKQVGAYFAKKLKRTSGAIHQALRGKSPVLLGRIITKLNYMDKVRAKRLPKKQEQSQI